jgi:succinate-acetate transporter protein
MATTDAGVTTGTVAEKDVHTTTGNEPVNGGAAARHHGFNYGGNPLVHAHDGNEPRLAAFGGEYQPGLYKSVENRKFANPAPLGLCAFALTTFVLSAINCGARGVNVPNVVVALAFGYGGLVQLLAGMWEMAVGNTFGATALSSYGGFWIAWALLFTPSLNILGSYPSASAPVAGDDPDMVASALGFFLTGWFIFTTILLLCTLRSTVMFFLLFFTLDLAFLMLACSWYAADNGNADASTKLQQAGGGFGMLAAFLAWYNAFAGIADSSNSFFLLPVFHFPWSEKAREARMKTERETV